MKKTNIPSQKLLLEDQKKGIGWYAVNVASIIFCIKNNQLNVLLEKRKLPPEKNKWIIPGKFLNYDSSPEQTAQAKLQEVLGKRHSYIEQLYLFGDPERELGKRVVTSTYMLLVAETNLKQNYKTSKQSPLENNWFPVKDLPELAFDTKEIIKYGIDRLKSKAEYTTIVLGLLPQKFSLTQLQ